MRYAYAFVSLVIVLSVWVGCVTVPVFHNTAEMELKVLASALKDARLEDLFRQYPTLKLVKSTDIGNGNTRHEFSYLVAEPEAPSKKIRPPTELYLHKRHTAFSINIFVNSKGVIYEILTPIAGESEIVKVRRNLKRHTKIVSNVLDKKWVREWQSEQVSYIYELPVVILLLTIFKWRLVGGLLGLSLGISPLAVFLLDFV